MTMSVYPYSTGQDTYLINVYKNGIFEVMFGNRSNNDITTNDYMHPDELEIKTVLLPKEIIDEICSLIEEIPVNGHKSNRLLDGWTVSLCLNDNNTYIYRLNEYDNDSISRLVALIVKLSPLRIDAHGWS